MLDNYHTVMRMSSACPQEGDSGEMSDFKATMLALLLPLHERLERTEAIQEQQDNALQVHCLSPQFLKIEE